MVCLLLWLIHNLPFLKEHGIKAQLHNLALKHLFYSLLWHFVSMKSHSFEVPIMAQQVKNLTLAHEDVDSLPGLVQWVKDLALPQAAV